MASAVDEMALPLPDRTDVGWAVELAETDDYDPCAALSWAVVTARGATVSSPSAVVLFHYGEFVGTATEQSFGWAPMVERVDDATIEVTFRWAGPGESNAEASQTATSTLTWDDEAGAVVRTGDVPDYSDGRDRTGETEGQVGPFGMKDSTGNTGEDTSAAFPGAGGAIPSDATEATETRQASADPADTEAIIQTESGSIKCDVNAGESGVLCMVQTWCDAGGDCSVQLGVNDTEPTFMGGESFPSAMQKQLSPQAIGSGEAVYYGDIVCGAPGSDALVCWSTVTGAGFTYSGEQSAFTAF